jgi:putative ABC transport system substrate-binding protein
VDRRRFVQAVVGVSVGAPLAARGQSSGRTYRLGILRAGSPPPTTDTVLAETFTLPLRNLGYVEGRNLVIEQRSAEGRVDRLSGYARELADLRVNVILAVGPAAIKAAKDATTTIPIVLFTNGDPVAAGFVTNLARPEGNVTGVLITPEGSLAVKRLELVRETVPRATRIALLVSYDQGSLPMEQILETRNAAAALGLDLDIAEIKGRDYARVFAALAARRPQALVVGAQSVLLRDRNSIIELAAKYRLPAIYEWPRQVRDGGLMSYGANDVETYAQVASYIDRIFKGAKAVDLPIWQPSKLELVINLKTAKAMGLTLPSALLLRADEVIQ